MFVKPRCEVPGQPTKPSAMSFAASPHEFERLDPCLATPRKHPQDRIEHSIQVLAYVLGKKAQQEVAVLLQQLVLPPIASIRDRIREMLSAIEFDRQTRSAHSR